MILRKTRPSSQLSRRSNPTDLLEATNPASPPGVTESYGEEPTSDKRNTTPPTSDAQITDQFMPNSTV